MSGSVAPGAPAGPSGCPASTKRGEPCRAPPLPGSAWCAFHAPELAEQRQAARSRGAVASNKLRAIEGKRSRLDAPAALARFTADLIHRTVEGRLPADVARTAFYGLSIQRQLLEASEMEKRLTALEQRLATQRGSRRVG